MGLVPYGANYKRQESLMKKVTEQCFLITAAVITLFITPSLARGEEESLLHRDTLVAFHIINSPKDPGVSWLLTNWLSQIKASKKFLPEQKHAFSDLFKIMPKDIEGGIINKDILVIIAPVPSNSNTLKDALFKIIKKIKPLEKFNYKEYKGYYRADETKLRLSGFAVSENYVILTSNSGYIKQTVDILKGKKQRLSDDSRYEEIMALLPSKSDITLFANNKDRGFSKVLKEWEKQWKMTVFLSAPYLDSMGLSFDVIDGDKIKGVFIFKCLQKEKIPDVLDDAKFLGEVFRRKFAKEKIKYTSNVTLKNDFVFLDLEASGLKPLWVKLFNQ